MQPASLEVLEKAAVPPAQARAIVQAIEIAGARDTLATRRYYHCATDAQMRRNVASC